MIRAYVDAYRVFDDPEYLNTALRSAAFINENIKTQDNRLNRNYKDGKSSVNAFLDDYAFVTSAFISLYQATFEDRWLKGADDLLQYALVHFYDSNTGFFFYTSDIDPPLICAKNEMHDNVIPSSNSEMAKNLFILGIIFQRMIISKSRRECWIM